MPSAVIVDTAADIVQAFARRVETLAREAMAARGRFAVAVTGGSAAELCLPGLVDADVDWSRVDVFFGDERAVPPAHEDANYGLAHRLWLGKVAVDPARVHRMAGEQADLAGAAAEYESILLRVLGDPPRLDLVMLGVGPDGHVCSLFPGHALLAEDAHWAAAVTDSPKPPAGRLTLTLPSLLEARAVIVVATGVSKADAVREAMDDDSSALPIALVAHGADDVTFLLDRDASGGSLGRTPDDPGRRIGAR